MPFDEVQNLLTSLRFARARCLDQWAKETTARIGSERSFHREEAIMANHRCQRIIRDLNANMSTGVDPDALNFGEQVDALLGPQVEAA